VSKLVRAFGSVVPSLSLPFRSHVNRSRRRHTSHLMALHTHVACGLCGIPPFGTRGKRISRGGVAEQAYRKRGYCIYLCNTLLERLPQDLEDMVAELGPFIQEAHPWCTSDTPPGIGTWPPQISPTSEMV
jgi:hypothetical protein